MLDYCLLHEVSEVLIVNKSHSQNHARRPFKPRRSISTKTFRPQEPEDEETVHYDACLMVD